MNKIVVNVIVVSCYIVDVNVNIFEKYLLIVLIICIKVLVKPIIVCRDIILHDI